jgi:hypothetical protein
MLALRRVAGLWGRPRCLFLLMLVLNAARAHWHERWEYGALHNYPWYGQDWVHSVTDFYCDDTCEDRLMLATTIDREFKALVDIFNQTTGGPRDVYRGAFEGHNHTIAALGMAARRAASLNQWKRMDGWETILTAHTSTSALCTALKLEGNVSFTREFCYETINASSQGPLFPNPRWSIIEDCCLKFNRTIGHGLSAFFWTDEYAEAPTCAMNGVVPRDPAGYLIPPLGCKMVYGMGLVVGRYGRILRTEDGGHNWENVASPTTAHLHSISMNVENTKVCDRALHVARPLTLPSSFHAPCSFFTPADSFLLRTCMAVGSSQQL